MGPRACRPGTPSTSAGWHQGRGQEGELMPVWRPVSRRQLVAALRRLGFQGPYSGGKHEFMVRGERVLTIPNPHRGDIGLGLLAVILRQAGVSRKEWERA